ncbi:MAG: hypothetical protein KKA42_05310 [candidate division Zixibacteria bacterium]|nr:hypothetical protein [candidate division Zixibacteria bacterium]
MKRLLPIAFLLLGCSPFHLLDDRYDFVREGHSSLIYEDSIRLQVTMLDTLLEPFEMDYLCAFYAGKVFPGLSYKYAWEKSRHTWHPAFRVEATNVSGTDLMFQDEATDPLAGELASNGEGLSFAVGRSGDTMFVQFREPLPDNVVSNIDRWLMPTSLEELQSGETRLLADSVNIVDFDRYFCTTIRPPGRYWLLARFSNYNWKDMAHPVWTGTITSDTVWFEVL